MTTTDSNNRTYFAIAVILTAMFAMSLQSIAMKYISSSLTLWQITIFRSIIILCGLVPFLIIAIRNGKIKIRETRWIGLRGMLMVAMNLLYYGALPLMPIAVASTAAYTAPVFVFIMAVLLLKEKINIFGIVATLAAFVGTFLVVRPGGSDFNIFVVLPLLSAVTYGSAHVITRMKCQQESLLVMVVAVHVSFLLVGLCAQFLTVMLSDELRSAIAYPFIVGDWTPMTPKIWGIMLGFAALNTVTHLGFAKAYQAAPSSIVAPWEYTYLPFVSVLSFVIFGEVPDWLMILGMIIIILSGIVILFSEALAKVFRPQPLRARESEAIVRSPR